MTLTCVLAPGAVPFRPPQGPGETGRAGGGVNVGPPRQRRFARRATKGGEQAPYCLRRAVLRLARP